MASCLRHSAPDRLRIGGTETELHDGGPLKREDLVCCKHCGYIWSWKPGSGRKRGWCMACNGLLCGRKECRQKGCVHWMQKLDNLEAGRPEDYKPIAVSVTAAPPGG